MGPPAARKSTAIKLGTAILRKMDYNTLAPERMSRQSFLDELYRINQPSIKFGVDELDIEAMFNLPGKYPYEMAIHAGEFIDFIGQNDKDYLMLLTSLWDNLPTYSNPKVSKTSVTVDEPTINLLGGATTENLNMAFPSTMMDTGTLSRFLFIHSNSSNKKVLFPKPADKAKTQQVVDFLTRIKNEVKGNAKFTPDAKDLLQHIYDEQRPLDDPRFSHYSGRRLPHLIKLCMIHAAARISTEIDVNDVAYAHTILMTAEHSMPLALGHFGRSRQSITQHAILEYLEMQKRPVSIRDLYSVFSGDFSRETDFQSMLFDMFTTGKIDSVLNTKTDKKDLVVKPRTLPKWAQALVIPDLLTAQERETIGM